MPQIPSLPLNDGYALPQLGLGVWQVPGDLLPTLIPQAVGQGCRLIDGAFIYGNEEAMGAGLRAAPVPREELFVTTKIWNTDQGFDAARAALEGSLRRIGLDYLDLVLIHWPCPGQDLYAETWKTLVAPQTEGLVRSIGVSNFEPAHLDRITAETGVVPALNQVEIHPGLQQSFLRAENARRGIVTQS
ncbi:MULTISPECIES: aldo/keto reductase [Pseudooceanicola]|uniref:aldo/keto reductase n=1 Tax=Pseudooceanicola TaxID=1679449 RepID=UPI001EF1156A